MIRTMRFGLVALAATALLPLTLSAQDPVLGEVEPYTVGSALPPTTPGATLVEMTLDDAIARALDVNLDLQSARLNPQIQAFASRRPRRNHGQPTVSTTAVHVLFGRALGLRRRPPPP